MTCHELPKLHPTLSDPQSPVTAMATFNFVNHSVTLTARKKTRLRQTLDPRQVTPCWPITGRRLVTWHPAHLRLAEPGRGVRGQRAQLGHGRRLRAAGGAQAAAAGQQVKSSSSSTTSSSSSSCMMTRSGREEKVADTRATQLTREARFYTSRGAASQARDALVEGITSQCVHVYLHYWPLAPRSPGPGPHQPGGGGPVGQQPPGVRTPGRGQGSRRGRPGEGRSWHLISMWLSSSSQDPRCLKVLLVKAEALFDSRSFEHSLLYFYQAAKLSPNNKTAHEGISKCCRTIQHKLRKNAFTSVKCLLTYLADADGEKSIDSFLDSFYLENRRFGKISRGDHFMKLIHGDKHFLMHLKLQLQREKVSPDNILSVLTESEKYLGKREVFWSALWRGGLHIQTVGFFNFVIDIV